LVQVIKTFRGTHMTHVQAASTTAIIATALVSDDPNIALLAYSIDNLVTAAWAHRQPQGTHVNLPNTEIDPNRLGCTNVELLSSGVTREGWSTYYTVVVTSEFQAGTWQVSRCYDDFANVHRWLGDEFPHSPFPSRASGWFDADKRRLALESWLRHLITAPPTLQTGNWVLHLRNFLEAPLQPAVEEASQGDGVTSSETVVGKFVHIEVPPEATPGQKLPFKTPDGLQYYITIPEGAVAGQALEVRINESETN